MEFQHFAYSGKLSFREADGEIECYGCEDVINGLAYISEEDDVIVCDAYSRLLVSYISYRWMYCDFNIDFKCTKAFINDENEIEKRDDEDLQRTRTLHFSHPHQLTRCKVSPMTEFEEDMIEEIWEQNKLECVACKWELQDTQTFMTKVNGFSFYCNKCDVDLHVSCAKYRTRATKHSCHPHNLLQLGKSIIEGISCRVCGRKNCNDSLFSCRKCDFNVHPKCIPQPSSFQHKRHLHPLTLVSPFAEDDSEDYYCDMCETERNPEIHVYYCVECNYIAHINCVLSEMLRVSFHPHPLIPNGDDDKETIFLCDRCEQLCIGSRYSCKLCSFNLESRCATSKDETLKEKSIKTIVNHFSHRHQITRYKIGILESHPDFDLNCMACRQCICCIIYACTQCLEFFVHESCLKHMLMEVQILFHPQHPLHTFPFISDPFEICKACGEYVEHLVFSCLQCDISMHYSCAKYQFREIKHNCHADHHLLHLGKGFFSDESPLYTACGLACKDTLFNCLKCRFYIHLECIPLPSIVKHKRHLHPLVLTTLVTEDGSEEYYCDTCETQRYTEHDIYYCKECNYTSHIDCVLSEVEPPEEIL
ncbi:hypothetical protein CXB51_005884 [Gossypium anomalum]|uniref:Zinc finger PHD-type domain-containing protein n=1 Tax=Gossypium anomalum TaxID=47600 RepID=A0A8J5ZG30_9ROSI|nr:hypothetical protein CXB51_005884 [Gossypium anomalum]